jgi:hypothetical protein
MRSAKANEMETATRAAKLRERILLEMELALPAAFAMRFGGKTVKTVGLFVAQIDEDAPAITQALGYSFAVEHDPHRLNDATHFLDDAEADDPRWETQGARKEFDQEFRQLFPSFDGECEICEAFSPYACVIGIDEFADITLYAPYCLWHQRDDGGFLRTVVGLVHQPWWEQGEAPEAPEPLGVSPAWNPTGPSAPVLPPPELLRRHLILEIEERLPDLAERRLGEKSLGTVAAFVDCETWSVDYRFSFSFVHDEALLRVDTTDKDAVEFFRDADWALPQRDEDALRSAVDGLHRDANGQRVLLAVWHRNASGQFVATPGEQASVAMWTTPATASTQTTPSASTATSSPSAPADAVRTGPRWRWSHSQLLVGLLVLFVVFIVVMMYLS